MKKGSTTFLKTVLVLIALAALAGMIRLPQLEGRATNLPLISIYSDPFIIYIYIASIPFFGALLQAFKLLGHIENNKVFSQMAVNKLKNIKYCATAIICLLVGAMTFVRFASGGDDSAGAIAVGIVLTFASIVVATAAAVAQKLLQSAVDLKSENDLTV